MSSDTNMINEQTNPSATVKDVDFTVKVKANFDETNGVLTLDTVTIENDDVKNSNFKVNTITVNNNLDDDLKTKIENLIIQAQVPNGGGKKSKSKKQKKTKGKKGKSVKRR